MTNDVAVTSYCTAGGTIGQATALNTRGAAAARTHGDSGVCRRISAEVAPDGIDTAIRIARKQLPGARQQHGFDGFLLLADRAPGKLVTISLRESRDDLRAVESRAMPLRGQAAGDPKVLRRE